MNQYEILIKMLCDRFDRLESKVDDLNNYKSKTIGFSVAIVGLFSILGFFAQLIF